MLLHQEVVKHLLTSPAGNTAIDDATLLAFSTEVERFVVSFLLKLRPKSPDSNSPDVDELEESMLKELEGDGSHFSDLRITYDDVKQLIENS